MRDFAVFSGRKGIFAAIFVVLGALLEGFSLILIIPLLAIVIGSGQPAGKLETAAKAAFHLFGIERPFGQLALLLGLFAVLMLVRAAVLSVRDVMVAELRTDFVDAQRMRVAERLAVAQWDQVVALRHARITHVMGSDVQRIGAAANISLQCTVAAAMLLMQCVLVFILAPVLAGVAFVTLVIGAIAFIPVIRRARALGQFHTMESLSLVTATTQFLGGLKLAISQNMQASFVAEFRQTMLDMARRHIDYIRQQTSTRLLLATLPALVGGLMVLIGFGVFHVAAPTLITLLLIIARMSGPVGQIQQGAQHLAHALPAYQQLKDLEQELATIPQPQSERTGAPPIAEGPIVFENVSFRHPTDDGDGGSVRGVRAVSLTIRPGEFIGMTGPSGAGKTTFADLLVGLFPPQQGRIAVAGTPLQGAVLASWRGRISYISQDPFLFHDSVRRNLAWANPQATEKKMWDALALAGADQLGRRMERGLDTVVGERGTLVSGGERQRIALARAILREPRLLVLDEATSAIDVAGEREILDRLRALAPRPTIVIIAHRAESLTLCDHIYRLEAGRCVDDKAAARD